MAGIAVGLAAAIGVTRVLQSLLYEVSPTDPAILAAVSVLLLVVALLATWIPAHRAATVDPAATLRAE